ncbi:MAG: mechanosensitive ion channel family protein [Luteolibacter sp.]
MFESLFLAQAAEPFEAMATLRGAFESIGNDLLEFAPKLLVAIVIFFVGWVFASVFSRMIRGTFRRGGLDKLFSQSEIGKSIGRLGVHPAAGNILSKSIYWIMLLFTVKAAADSAGMSDISAIIVAVFGILPKIVTALIILAVGIFIADMVRRTITAALSRLGLEYAATLASLVFGLILVIVLTVVLSQLGIQADLLISSVQIILFAAAFAFALGLGLGMKDAASALIAGIYARDVYEPGVELTLEGEVCELAGIGPLTAKLKRPDGSIWVVPNTRLTKETLSAKPTLP